MALQGAGQGQALNFIVPFNSLQKLACTKCRKYLSVFPVYTHPTSGSVCGRCPLSNTDGFIKNDLYETAVQYQQFPCIYDANGCLEKLFPSAVCAHESRCLYKKLNCPTREYNNCLWQGYPADVLEHFELKHRTFILKDGTFEVDFVNTHKENYLFPYGEDLYIVRRQAVPAKNLFICGVIPIKGGETGKFVLTLESGNHVQKYSLSQNLGEELNVDRNCVRSVLKDPMSIIAKVDIEIAHKDDLIEVSSTDNTENETNSLVDYEQLRDLECPVCQELMVSPIYQCDIGHSICSECKNNPRKALTHCPTCRQAYKTPATQNFTLENIVKHIYYPCKYAKCKFATKAKDIKQHEAACIFGSLKCPLKDYENCEQEMSSMDIYDHVANNHYENLLELECVSIPFEVKAIWTLEDTFDECYIMKSEFQLFKLCFLFESGMCYWSVQLVGPAENCVKFRYELEILDNSGLNGRVYFKKVCAPLCAKNDTFTDDKAEYFVCLDFKQIKKFVVRQLTYRMRVLLAND